MMRLAWMGLLALACGCNDWGSLEQQGIASASCLVGQASCGGACVDLQNDSGNCGACGVQCGDGTSCENGQCAAGAACATGQTMCNGRCLSTQSDLDNCGGCGRKCQGTCQGGVCSTNNPCQAPLTRCGDGTCHDLRNDPNNCGSCGVSCSANQSCSGGLCIAQMGCVSDADCAGGTPFCCSPTCVDRSSDPNNCGHCGVVCQAGQVCVGGACTDRMNCLQIFDVCFMSCPVPGWAQCVAACKPMGTPQAMADFQALVGCFQQTPCWAQNFCDHGPSSSAGCTACMTDDINGGACSAQWTTCQKD